MNNAQKIAKESTITFSGLVYGNLNRYLYTALLARWVGVEYLGIYSLANAIMLIAEVLAKMGLETGVMRFVSRLNPQKDKESIRRIIQSALKMTGIFSIIMLIFLLSGSNWLVNSILHESVLLRNVLIVFALTMPFNAFTLVSAFAAQGFKLMKYKVFVTQIINPTILLAVMMLSFWFISKEAALMLPMAVTGIMGCFLMFFFLKKLSGVSVNHVISASFDRSLLVFSFPLMLVTILQTLMHWMDILMLGYFTDAGTVGLYHPAARTAGLLQALLFSFISIYAPMVSQLHSLNKHSEMSNLFKLVSRWLISFGLPISFIFILFSGKVMLLFGKDYLGGAGALVILTYATFIQTFLGAAGPLLSMTGHTRLVLLNSIGAFVINIILNIFLIPKFGIMGAAWATLISLTAIGLARVIEVRVILGLTFISKKLFKSIFSGLATVSILWIIRPMIMDFHTLITLLLAVCISIGSFGLILWIFGFEEEDRDFWRGIGILRNSYKNKGK